MQRTCCGAEPDPTRPWPTSLAPLPGAQVTSLPQGPHCPWTADSKTGGQCGNGAVAKPSSNCHPAHSQGP